jgi:hypothetical protein
MHIVLDSDACHVAGCCGFIMCSDWNTLSGLECYTQGPKLSRSTNISYIPHHHILVESTSFLTIFGEIIPTLILLKHQHRLERLVPNARSVRDGSSLPVRLFPAVPPLRATTTSFLRLLAALACRAWYMIVSCRPQWDASGERLAILLK